MKSLKKILGCYSLFLLANSGVFGYEVGIVEMSVSQSLVLRGVTLITDWFESSLFVNSGFFKNLADGILRRIRIRRNWVSSGLRLALIGPPFYLIKLLIVSLLLPGIGIAPIAISKILLAFGISFLLSFCWGVIFNIFPENLPIKLQTFVRSFRLPWIPKPATLELE
ncbi:MAG: hypothetical protein WCG84_03470 [Candidatus Moraniibacteriota bacterium]